MRSSRVPILQPKAYRDLVLDTSPLAYWQLGERAGAVARDEMGLRHGTYVGAPTMGVVGPLAGDPATGVGFNGSTQYVSVADSIDWNVTDFSLLVWFNTTAAGVSSKMIAHQAGATYYFIGIDTSNKFRIGSSLDSAGLAAVGPVINNGAWHMGALCRKAGVSLASYVDGALVDARASTSSSGYALDAVMYLATAATAAPYTGTLSGAAIWNRTLTASEVSRLYRVGVAR